ncbi:MAG: thioredoxin family protein [Paludibacter sp.]|nr:thioredoxin family protein [Paludibacter sp.]
MNKDKSKVIQPVAIILFFLFMIVHSGCYAAPRNLSIKLRGVYDSKITLTPFDGLRFASPLAVVPDVKNGGEAHFEVPESMLPGEFLIRFDYRAKKSDAPYPAELQLYINREDIRVGANPLFLRGDSLLLDGDRENKAWFAFMNHNGQQRQQLGLLQQLLEQYDRPGSAEWTQVLKAYESRRKAYNHWIDAQVMAQKDLYVSHLYRFQRLQDRIWKTTPAMRTDALCSNWFKEIDLNDTLILKSRQMNELMNGFMGIYGAISTTDALRDSLFTEAGKVAIDAASTGHPRVYGWMVDYFYNGYETYNIVPGMKMLEQHLNNPRCLTSKKIAIAKRLDGLKTMKPGVKVRNVVVRDIIDREETINMATCNKPYRLLVFYDSECDHCKELLAALSKWYAVPDNSKKLEVVSVSVDNSRDQWIPAFMDNAFPWIDRYAPGGINSQAATNYYVLSAPNMFLVTNAGDLVSMPNTVEELETAIYKH